MSQGQPPPYSVAPPDQPPPPGFAPSYEAPYPQAPYPPVHRPYPQVAPYPPAGAPYPPQAAYPQGSYQPQAMYQQQEPQVMVIHTDRRQAGKPMYMWVSSNHIPEELLLLLKSHWLLSTELHSGYQDLFRRAVSGTTYLPYVVSVPKFALVGRLFIGSHKIFSIFKISLDLKKFQSQNVFEAIVLSNFEL